LRRFGRTKNDHAEQWKSIADTVPFRHIGVLTAIRLDDQPQGTTGEVSNIGADRILAAEPEMLSL